MVVFDQRVEGIGQALDLLLDLVHSLDDFHQIQLVLPVATVGSALGKVLQEVRALSRLPEGPGLSHAVVGLNAVFQLGQRLGGAQQSLVQLFFKTFFVLESGLYADPLNRRRLRLLEVLPILISLALSLDAVTHAQDVHKCGSQKIVSHTSAAMALMIILN